MNELVWDANIIIFSKTGKKQEASKSRYLFIQTKKG